MYEKIFDLLNDAVTDIFLKLQDEYGVECGDCPPMIEIDLDKATGELAEVIKEAFEYQLGKKGVSI